jgi:hypothetical protein
MLQKTIKHKIKAPQLSIFFVLAILNFLKCSLTEYTNIVSGNITYPNHLYQVESKSP